MNWEIIGSTGEWAGAIAVVATLFYLARQLRESNSLARSASVHEVMSAYGDMNEMIITSPHVAELLARLAERGGEFTPAEVFQLEAYCMKKIDIYMQAEEAYANGHMSEALYTTIKEDAAAEYDSLPGLFDHYKSCLSRYSWNGEIAQIIRNLV